ncbi:MAG: CDP-alcohol phosphatidyltransferase family protein [Synergistaceae bacterium]|nr:CDP-alcohol phosphatidyltransferase family protein [Synergistaceae bacterium]
MHYTPQYFRDNLPAWKYRKDFILTKIFYRPVSFYISAFCANHGIQANSVSVFSSFVAVLACSMFLFARYELNILGAVLVSVWGLLDCTDGNLARCVRPQPFGEFVDAESSYSLVCFLGVSLGISVYFTQGGGGTRFAG